MRCFTNALKLWDSVESHNDTKVRQSVIARIANLNNPPHYKEVIKVLLVVIARSR